jgi:predicted O-methyltransferase YrrM
MKQFLKRLRTHFQAGLSQKRDLDILYNQIAGLIQIQNAMTGHPVLRPMRGWAMSPDAMAWILAELQQHDQPTIIEFGAGQSTVILAAAIKHRGGLLYTVEHDPAYMDLIRKQLEACGLATCVRFLTAPLVDSRGTAVIRSYDTQFLPEAKVNLALVDGPPITNGMLARLVPLRWCVNHLSSNGVIFLDDSLRESEQSCLTALKTEFPTLVSKDLVAEKGLVELRLP